MVEFSLPSQSVCITSVKSNFTCLQEISASDAARGICLKSDLFSQVVLPLRCVTSPISRMLGFQGRSATDAHKSQSKYNGPTLTFSAGAALLKPLFTRNNVNLSGYQSTYACQVPLSARLRLGGGAQLRGFEPFSVGPHAGDDSIGGDFSFVSGVSIRVPVFEPQSDNPSLAESLHLHSFLNAGSVIARNGSWLSNSLISQKGFAESQSLMSVTGSMLHSTRVSFGAGIVLGVSRFDFQSLSFTWCCVQLGPVRLELNMTRPIRAEANDRTRSWEIALSSQPS